MSLSSPSLRADVLILIAGLMAAVLSGVAAYRHAGMYGDAFVNFGLYRISDGGAQTSPVVRRVVTDDGLLLHYVFDWNSRKLIELRVTPGGSHGDVRSEVVRIDLAQGVPGRFDLDRRAVAWDEKEGRIKIGFSLDGEGPLDVWQYWGADGHLQEIRLSRRADGVVDRWEFYDQGQLARVEEDANHDGRVDRWLTYEAGILMDEAVDGDGDGLPDFRGE